MTVGAYFQHLTASRAAAFEQRNEAQDAQVLDVALAADGGVEDDQTLDARGGGDSGVHRIDVNEFFGTLELAGHDVDRGLRFRSARHKNPTQAANQTPDDAAGNAALDTFVEAQTREVTNIDGIVEGTRTASRISVATTGRLLATLAVDVSVATAAGGGGGSVGASGTTVMNVLTTRGAGSSLSAVTERRT